ncbi:hypothetical protein ACP3TD_09520 [Pseudarthrobacter sp. 1G09]|uniref:hypothetical protein n=1 Tax=Pseudarthrobacter sp. 1G09 TaxID=3416178 RepID=UPI003CECEEA6
MSLFITCPDESVERTTSCYTALGWTLNTEMSDHNVSCSEIARPMDHVGGAEELVGGPDTPSKVNVSFDLGGREAVDELIERARAAGGRAGGSEPPMTSHSCTSASSTTPTVTTTRRSG